MNLTLDNTAIVLDSTADFPGAQIRFPNMRVVPLYVRFGEESFRDYVELDPHDFYARLKTAAELPTTSQPTPQDFITVYHALAAYERIYSLHISARLSGTFQSASIAATDEGDRIRLVDTESVSVGIGMLALGIQELLARGTTDEEVEALIAHHRERSGILFTVDTLEFLAKGGRIGRAKALMGSLLNVKPILSIDGRRGRAADAGPRPDEGVRGVPQALRGGDDRRPRPLRRDRARGGGRTRSSSCARSCSRADRRRTSSS